MFPTALATHLIDSESNMTITFLCSIPIAFTDGTNLTMHIIPLFRQMSNSFFK